MKDDEKVTIANAVKDTRTKVEDRREKMFEGLENLKDALQVIFDNIEGVPEGLGIYQMNEYVMVGLFEGDQQTAAPILQARVLWNVPDKGAEHAEYEVSLSHVTEPETFTDITELAKYVAEPVIEDIFRAQDLAEAAEATAAMVDPNAPPPDGISAPPDQAAQHTFVYKVSTAQGHTHEGELSALSVHAAGDQLREAGWTNIEKLEIKA